MGNYSASGGTPPDDKTIIINASGELQVDTANIVDNKTLKATNNIISVANNITTGNNGSQTAIGSQSTGMLGYGILYTPSINGKVLITINVIISSGSITSSGNSLQLYYGTGTPPSGGSAPTGTAVNIPFVYGTSSSGTHDYTIPLTEIVQGLTLGTQYWFDIALFNNTGVSQYPSNMNYTIIEM